MHKVLKPFKYSANGLTNEKLSVGDERDFGSLARGLEAAGYIAPVDAPVADEPELPSPVDLDELESADEPVDEAHEEPAEEELAPPVAAEHHAPRRGRRKAAE